MEIIQSSRLKTILSGVKETGVCIYEFYYN